MGKRSFTLLWQIKLKCHCLADKKIKMSGGGDDREIRCGCDCSRRRSRGRQRSQSREEFSSLYMGSWTGLTWAARKNYTELLEILLSHPDIKINYTVDTFGGRGTALMIACNVGNSAIVPGLDINYQDENGNTAALLASLRGHTGCERLLAETGRVDSNCDFCKLSTLSCLSRDAVLLILFTNNTQERLVTPLVDRLEGEITTQAREQLL